MKHRPKPLQDKSIKNSLEKSQFSSYKAPTKRPCFRAKIQKRVDSLSDRSHFIMINIMGEASA